MHKKLQLSDGFSPSIRERKREKVNIINVNGGKS